MALTRLQTFKNNRLESEYLEDYSDNDSDVSIPECNPRGVTNNIERANLLDLERAH